MLFHRDYTGTKIIIIIISKPIGGGGDQNVFLSMEKYIEKIYWNRFF